MRGSEAVFQWIREQNPSVNDSLYEKIEEAIKAGRANFQNGQRRLLDVRRQYKDALGSFWRGMWLRAVKYPKVTLADFDIVSTDRANEAFRTKKEAGPI